MLRNRSPSPWEKRFIYHFEQSLERGGLGGGWKVSKPMCPHRMLFIIREYISFYCLICVKIIQINEMPRIRALFLYRGWSQPKQISNSIHHRIWFNFKAEGLHGPRTTPSSSDALNYFRATNNNIFIFAPNLPKPKNISCRKMKFNPPSPALFHSIISYIR